MVFFWLHGSLGSGDKEEAYCIMYQKILAILVCLTMLLSASCAALAQEEFGTATLSFLPGEELSEMPIVADVSSAAAMRLAFTREELGLSLMLNDKDMLALNLSAKDGALYVQSDALFDKPVYITPEDVVDIAGNLMKQSGADETAVQRVQAMLRQMFGLPVDAAALGIDRIQKKITGLLDVIAKDSALTALISEVGGRLEITQGDFASDVHDPGKTRVKLDISQADVLKLLATDTGREVVKLILLMQNPFATDEALAADADEMLDNARDSLENARFKLVLGAILSENGAPVSLVMQVFNGEEAAEASAQIELNHLTRDAGDQMQLVISDREADMDIVLEGFGGGDNAITFSALATERGKAVFTGKGSITTEGDYDTRLEGEAVWGEDGEFNAKLETAFAEEEPWTFDLHVTRRDEAVVTVKSRTTVRDDGMEWLLSMSSPFGDRVEEMIIALVGSEVGDAIRFDLSVSMNNDPIKLMSEIDKPLGTLRLDIAKLPYDGRFDKLRDAAPETSMRLYNMTEKELEELLVEMQTNLLQAVLAIMSEMPPSVMELMLGTPQP